MVRLYRALMNTGATMKIETRSEFNGIIFTFWYGGKNHKTVHSFESVERCPDLIVDMLSVELVKFVTYVNSHNA